MMPGRPALAHKPARERLMSVGLAGAWSFCTRLRPKYFGSCLRVRRSSDNSERFIDFAPNSDMLDVATLLSFCGAGDGYVASLMDQSGNSRPLAQTAVAQQPRIVTAGVLENIGGLPAGKFEIASSHYLARADACGTVAPQAFTLGTVVSMSSHGGAILVLGNSNPERMVHRWGDGASYATNIYAASSGGYASFGPGVTSPFHAEVVRHPSGAQPAGCAVRVNRSELPISDSLAGAFAWKNVSTAIGARWDGLAFKAEGWIASVLLFSTELTGQDVVQLDDYLNAQRALGIAGGAT